MSDPLWYRYNGAAMMPLLPEVAARQFWVGGVYLLELHREERQSARHKAYFATLHDDWTRLQRPEWPTSEHLRKYALIQTGWREERALECPSPELASEIAAFAQPLDPYAVLVAEGPLLRVWTARSQSYAAMGRENFNRSMDDVLDYCAGLQKPSATGGEPCDSSQTSG
jgi:hypothetical protein